MKPVLTLLGVATFLLAVSLLGPGDVRGNTPPPGNTTGALLTCPDVYPDGAVNVFDILRVAQRYGPGAHPLYDLNGDGSVNVIVDILGTARRFGQACPLVDTQIARAALATMQYLTLDVGLLLQNGYVQTTQDVPGQGRHFSNLAALNTVFNPEQPQGLVYDPSGKLVALFYVMWGGGGGIGWFGQSGHLDKFNFDGLAPCDTTACSWSGTEDTWHLHGGLCVIGAGTPGVIAVAGVTQSHCTTKGSNLWFATYGWMNHLWAHKLNPNGRFADCAPPWGYSNCPD